MKASEIFRQYSWLAETIYKSGGITFRELNERWVRSPLSGGMPMLRQTFNAHRKEIRDAFGISIECHKPTNRYYIDPDEGLPGNDFQNWMIETLSVSNVLMESVSLKDRLLMEHIPAGKDHFQTIVRAMKDNHKLRMTYRKFGQAEPYTIVVEPYAIKVFKQRWYLLAKNYKREAPSIYALDRMEALSETDEHFDLPAGFSARDFFGDCYGVMHEEKRRPQHIVVRAYDRLAHYLRTLPLHHSQTEVATTPMYTDFSYYLCPTFDFMQELLAQGKDVEVLKPASLRKEMMEMLRETMGRYEE